MTWTKLDPGAHVAMWCATEGCWGIPFHRLEVDGVASNYCSNCRAKIEARDDARLFGVGFTREYPDGRVEHIPPSEVVMHGNTITHKPK